MIIMYQQLTRSRTTTHELQRTVFRRPAEIRLFSPILAGTMTLFCRPHDAYSRAYSSRAYSRAHLRKLAKSAIRPWYQYDLPLSRFVPMIKTHMRLLSFSSSSRCYYLRSQYLGPNYRHIPFDHLYTLRHLLWKNYRFGELVAMTSLTQTRSHGGHSHHHDNTYLTSANKKDAGVRITRIGLYVNLAMAVGKGIGGYYFNSQALVADAFHAMTDLVSDFMTLGTVSWSLKPPSSRFPSGYGKIESLGSLGVSSLLLAGGILMGLNACEALYHQFFIDAVAAGSHSHGGIFGHSHSHGPADLGPNINAAWLAAGSIVIKEYLYRASKASTRIFQFQH